MEIQIRVTEPGRKPRLIPLAKAPTHVKRMVGSPTQNLWLRCVTGDGCKYERVFA
jgi:hypothetical protein